MKLKFLGGADVVGRLGMLLNNKGANLLFEYGMKPIKPPEYPIPAPPLETAFLTHCHIDHSGMIPWLCGKYGTKVHAVDGCSMRAADERHPQGGGLGGIPPAVQ
jgi:putative mRNA 3-end processing factor